MVCQDRLAAIKNSLDLLENAHWSVKAFAVAVDKQAASPNDPVEHASATGRASIVHDEHTSFLGKGPACRP